MGATASINFGKDTVALNFKEKIHFRFEVCTYCFIFIEVTLANSTTLMKVVSCATGIWSDSPTVHYYVTRLANLTLHTALCIESLQDLFLKQVFLLILSLRPATVRPTQPKKVTLWRIRPNFGGLDSPQKTRFMTVSERLSGPENKFNDQKLIISFTVLNLFIFSHYNFPLFFVFEFSVIHLWSSLYIHLWSNEMAWAPMPLHLIVAVCRVNECCYILGYETCKSILMKTFQRNTMHHLVIHMEM